jgi:hypothetical protein
MTTTDTPSPPPTPQEAAARIEELKANPEWRDRFLAGNGPQVTEFQNLTTIAHSDRQANQIEMAVAGQLYNGLAGQPAGHMEDVATAAMLRDAGLGDDEIRQAVRGDPVTQAEYDTARREKDALMRDRDFAAKYLAKNGPEFAKMSRLNLILCSPIRQEKAA